MGGGSGIGTGAPISPLPSSYEPHSNPRPHGSVVRTHRRLKSPHKNKKSSSKSSNKSPKPPDKPLPPVGLKNVGNTCYANAALQCVLSTALSHALMDPKSTHIFRRYSSNPGILALGSGSVDSDDNHDSEYEGPFDISSPIAVARQTHKEARIKDREKRKSLKEKQLKHEKCTWLTGELTDVTRIYTATHLNLNSDGEGEESYKNKWPNLFNIFSISDEQRIVDPGGITRHVNKISPCLTPYQQEDAHEFLRSLLSTLTLDGHNRRLSSLFDGLLESAVTCQTCHRASITRDRYMDLSLDIQGKEILDLHGALKHFTQTELLDEHNKVTCQRCQTKQIVSKGLRLATAPTVLVCHLKRFAFDIYGRTTRLAKYVKYPLRLEIGDFMSRANQSKPPPYELVGVLVHAGQSCERGHYVAFVKSGDCWYKANDEVVTKVEEEVALRQQAYILFYEVAGMRARHGYEGFGKYHRRAMRRKHRERAQNNMGADATTPDGVSSGLCTDIYVGDSDDIFARMQHNRSPRRQPRASSLSPSIQERQGGEIRPHSAHAGTPNSADKVSSLLDSMLGLCGANSAAEAVRDAICDSAQKSEKKKKGKYDVYDAHASTYTKRLRPLPSSGGSQRSTSPLSYTSSGSKSKQRSKSAPKIKTPTNKTHRSRRGSSASRNIDSIFRCPTPDTHTRRATSETGVAEFNAYFIGALHQSVPNKPSQSSRKLSANEKSLLAADSVLIRSVSSNNMFEKEEEAIVSHEEESFVSASTATGGDRSVILGTPESNKLGKIHFSPAHINSHVPSPQKSFRYDSDEEDRLSDSAAVITRKMSLRRKSSSTPRSRRDLYASSGMLSKTTHDVKLPPLPRKPIASKNE